MTSVGLRDTGCKNEKNARPNIVRRPSVREKINHSVVIFLLPAALGVFVAAGVAVEAALEFFRRDSPVLPCDLRRLMLVAAVARVRFVVVRLGVADRAVLILPPAVVQRELVIEGRAFPRRSRVA